MKNTDNIFSMASFMGNQIPAPTTQNIFVFSLGAESFGIDLNKVQALRSVQDIIPIDGTHNHVIGTISVHDSAVPVMDLRIKYEMIIPQYDQLTVVTVLEIDGQLIGIVADDVDIKKILLSEIKSALELDMMFNAACIQGMIKREEERKIFLLDIDRVISLGEALIAKVESHAA